MTTSAVMSNTDVDPRTESRRESLHAMFNPQSIALIGATDRAGSVGATVLANLIEGDRKVFAVNPNRSAVLGLKTYPSIGRILEPVDLAVIVTPAPIVPKLVRDCVRAGVRSCVTISAGFRERGSQGSELERQIASELRRGGMALIGPNCLGLMNPLIGLNATFAEHIALPGNVAFLSQSGALCTAILDWSLQERVGFSAFVSTGSMVDVGWGDLIRYFGNDPNTHSILLYIESINDGLDFLAAAKHVAPKKPIIAIKAGRTQAASKAASSHTGALTGDDDVVDAAFRHCGVLRVDRISDLFHMADVLSKQPQPGGPRLTIVTNAGGPGVMATDALIEAGGQLATLTENSVQSLNAVLPPHWSHANPIDILGDADANTYAQALAVATSDAESDGVLVILSPQGMTDPAHCAEALIRGTRKYDKPVIASWMGGRAIATAQDLLNNAGIPTFSFPDAAARAFTYMWEYTKRRNVLDPGIGKTVTSVIDAIARNRTLETLEGARATGRKTLTELESKRVLEAYGLPSVPTEYAATADEAVVAAEKLAFPVVVKLHSESVTHKTDVQGVHLGIKDVAGVRLAFSEIKAAVQKHAGADAFQGVTVQPMITREGYELILGCSTDPQFGPVILFGSGGRLTEVFRDRALAMPPLTSALALSLIDQTKISRALKGVRGRAPVEMNALADIVVRFSQMAAEMREIKEIDINPLLASPEAIVALDARILLH